MSTLEELLAEAQQRGATQRAATLQQSASVNPDSYAEQRRQATLLGVPTAAVVATPDESARQVQSKRVETAVADAPVLRRKYTDDDFARLAHDEPGLLASMEQAIRRGWKTADTQSDATDINMAELEGKPLTPAQIARREQLEIQQRQFQREQSGEQAPQFVARTVGYSARQGLESIYTAIKGAGYGGAAGAAMGAPLGGVGAAPGAAAGMVAGAAVSTGLYSYRMEAASTWRELSQLKDLEGQPLDPAVARPAAMAVGVANAVIEVGSDAALALLIPGAGALLQGAVGKEAMKSALLQQVKTALADPARRSAVGAALKAAVGMGAIEGAEEFFQTLVGAGGRVAAKAATGKEFEGEDPLATLDEASRAALEAFVGTTLTFGALTGGAQYVSSRAQARAQKAQEASLEGERLKTLWAAANDSKLLTRAPETLAEFAQSAADLHPDGVKAVYIDARVLAEVLAENGLQIDQIAPGASESFSQGLASNGTVELPVGELLSLTAGKPVEEALLPNLRTSEDGYSAKEARAAQSEAARLIEQESEQVLKGAEDEAAARQSTAAVKDGIAQQLAATGRFTPEQNEVKATLAAAFYTTLGAKLGQTAEQAFAAYPLTVSSTGRATDVLDQPGGITVEGYRYGKTDRTTIAPVSYGTGLRGSGYETIMAHPDKRLQKRVYFYADKGTGINPEAGVGGRGHRAELRNVYDSDRDPMRLRTGDQYEFEGRVLDAGFSGYLTRMEGTQSAQVIMLGDQQIKAEPLGPLGKTRGKVVPAAGPRASLGRDVASDAVRANKGFPAGELTRQRWGSLVKALEPKAYEQMAAAGVFEGEGAFYRDGLVKDFESRTEAPDYSGELNQINTGSAAFKKWFGEGNTLVNQDGSPMLMFHGTTKANAKLTSLRRSSYGTMGPAVYLGDSEEASAGYEEGAMLRAYARGKYLTNMQWSDYVNKHGWEGAEAAATSDGWAGVYDTMFENAAAVWDPANIKIIAEGSTELNQAPRKQPDSDVKLPKKAGRDTAISIRIGPQLTGAQRMSIHEVAAYFDGITGPRDFTDPVEQARAVEQLAAEIEFQMQQEKSGLDWYEDDIKTSFELTAQVIPSLATSATKRQLFAVIAGLQSMGTLADANWDVAALTFEYYEKTGTIPGRNPANGNLWIGGPTSVNKEKALNFLNAMVADIGEEKTVEWVYGMHTVKELNDARKKWGKMGPGVTGKMSEERPGFFAFGPKVGPFVMNINGIHELTVDVWATRTFNRMFGSMVGPDGKIIDAPTEPQRRVAKELFSEVAAKTGIKPYQVQSVSWFFEQQLFNHLGTGSASLSFSDGARRFAARRGVQAAERDGEATKVFNQLTTNDATLDDFTAEKLPGLLSKENWAVLTAEDPNATKASPEANAAAQAALRADLDAVGATYIDAVGKYGEVQNALIVTGITGDQALALGQKYGQESILTRAGLVYSDARPNTPALGMEVYPTAPSDFYTEVPSTGGYFSVVLDWGSDNAEVTTVDPEGFAQRESTGPTPMSNTALVELRKQEKVLEKLLECI